MCGWGGGGGGWRCGGKGERGWGGGGGMGSEKTRVTRLRCNGGDAMISRLKIIQTGYHSFFVLVQVTRRKNLVPENSKPVHDLHNWKRTDDRSRYFLFQKSGSWARSSHLVLRNISSAARIIFNVITVFCANGSTIWTLWRGLAPVPWLQDIPWARAAGPRKGTPLASESWRLVAVSINQTCCFHLRKKNLFICWYNGGVFLVVVSHSCAMGCCGGNGSTSEQRRDVKTQKAASKAIEKQLKDDKITYRATHRLLLLGNKPWLMLDSLVRFDRGWFSQWSGK